jgi:hypothetical protein
VLQWIAAGSRVPLDEIRRHPHGALFPGRTLVAPSEEGWPGRLDVGNETMLRELAEIREQALPPSRPTGGFPFRLVSRRLPNAYNSSARDVPALAQYGGHNPAFMHPDDLAQLRLARGDVVEIRSDHAAIDAPERDGELRRIGSNTGRLVSVERDYDPYSGIPRMSGIPVAVERWEGELAPAPRHRRRVGMVGCQ